MNQQVRQPQTLTLVLVVHIGIEEGGELLHLTHAELPTAEVKDDDAAQPAAVNTAGTLLSQRALEHQRLVYAACMFLSMS